MIKYMTIYNFVFLHLFNESVKKTMIKSILIYIYKQYRPMACLQGALAHGPNFLKDI